MEYSNSIDMMTLSWCVPEIRESLLRVSEALDEQLASPVGSMDAITKARLHLHQTHGALQVASVEGVSVLTQEAELVLTAVEDETLTLDEHSVTVLKRVLNAVVEYLEDMHQSGTVVPALVLFPYYRELVQLRKVVPADPGVLFDVNLDRALPESVRKLREDRADREERAQTACRAFERALPALIRGDQVDAAVDMLHEAMHRLMCTQPHESASLFYWLSYALIDGIKQGALKVDLSTRRAVGRINIQNRHLFTSHAEVPAQFIKELLLLIAGAGEGSSVIDEVKHHFHLAQLVPADYERARYGLADPETVKVAQEALAQIRRCWEKIVSGAAQEVQPYAEASALLSRALDRTHYKGLAMLGKSLATMPAALAEQQPDVAEMLSIEVATAVLFMEEALAGALRSNPAYDDRAQELAARIGQLIAHPEQFDPTPMPWLVELSMKATDRITKTAFVNELKQNLNHCEQALDDYFRDESAVESLERVAPLLAESGAVLSMLEYKGPVRACQVIAQQVQDILEGRLVPGDADRTRLAEGISSLGFFVDTLLQSNERARRFRFDAERGMLFEDMSIDLDELEAQEAPQAEVQPVQSEPQAPDVFAQEPAAEEEPGIDSLSPEDAELHEIFLMEASEVLDAIEENLVIVRRSPEDREAMTTIRRAFHTLKGSGRMVGLDAFGEVAWSFEQMMNHWLSGDQDGTPALFALIEDGKTFFRSWTQALETAPRRVLDGSALQARCAAFYDRHGGDEADAPAPAAQRVADSAPMVAAAAAVAAPARFDVSSDAADADIPALGLPEQTAELAADGDGFGFGASAADDDASLRFDAADFSDMQLDGVELGDDADTVSLDADTVSMDTLTAVMPEFASDAEGEEEGSLLSALSQQEPIELGGVDIGTYGGEPTTFPDIGASAAEGAPAVDAAADGFSSSHNFAAVSETVNEEEIEQRLDGFLGDTDNWRTLTFAEADEMLGDDATQAPAVELEAESEAQAVDFGALAGDMADEAPAFDTVAEASALDTMADASAIAADDSLPADAIEAVAEETFAEESFGLDAQEIADAADEVALSAIDEPDASAAGTDAGFMALMEDIDDPADIPLLDLGDALMADDPALKPSANVFDPFGGDELADQSSGQDATSAAQADELPSVESVFGMDEDFDAVDGVASDAAPAAQARSDEAVIPAAPLAAAGAAALAAGAAGIVAAAAQDAVPAATPAAAEQPVADEEAGLVRIGERLIDAELFEIFNSEASGVRQRLKQDWANWHGSDALRAPESMVRALHTLVGTTRHVGLVQVRNIAQPLEKLLLKQRELACVLPEHVRNSIQHALEVVDQMLGEFADRIEPHTDMQTASRMVSLLENWDAELVDAPAQCTEKPASEVRGEDLLKKAAEVLGAARRGTEEKRDPLAGLSDDLDPDLGPVFFAEAEELMPQVDNNLREWRERPEDGSIPAALMRLFHTIKGSARMAGAMRFGQMIHELETQVEDALAQPPIKPVVIESVLSGYDQAVSAYEIMLHPELAASMPETQPMASTLAEEVVDQPVKAAQPEVEQPEQPATQCAQQAATAERAAVSLDTPQAPVLDCAAAAAAAAQANTASAQHVIRVRADLLDRMVAEAGEVSIARARLESEMGLIRQALNDLNENVARLRQQLKEIEIQAYNQMHGQMGTPGDSSNKTEYDPLEFDRYTRFQESAQMLAESVNDVSTVQQNALRALDAAMQDLTRQGQVSRSLQQGLMRVRMVQFSTVNDRLYRVVRQAGKDTDKRVTLEIKGGQAEIDRNVLDRMVGPIEHILRNSVAHGIEDRARRAQVGKPDVGELTVEVTQDGNEVIMRFMDDGQGLDLPKIEARARERGLIAPDHQPSERELAQLVFAPGFSTAKQVTALAGRGVGMDVVRAEVAGLGGRIDLDTVTGKGSCVTVHLPVSLAVTQVVLLGIEGAKFAVQSALVEQIVQMKPEALTEAYQAQRIEIGGEKVPFYFLGSLLEMSGVKPAAQRMAPVVLIRAGATRIALHVDTVVPNQEVVIKHIGPQLARLSGVAGATVLGNGDIVLILNPVQLAMARVAGRLDKVKATTFSASELQTAATVMVVDDSVTVRKVTQRLLMREGYNVLLAKDGVDALRQMAETVPDVMLVDIEMPRMDGFDLTKNVREHEDYANTPIIMITSRTAEKHRNHALQLGVDVFLGKPYAEDDLLRHIRSFTAQRAPKTVSA